MAGKTNIIRDIILDFFENEMSIESIQQLHNLLNNNDLSAEEIDILIENYLLSESSIASAEKYDYHKAFEKFKDNIMD